jgi:hypothetical protein
LHLDLDALLPITTGARMTEAPTRPVRHSAAPQRVESVESPSADVVSFPQDLLRYLLDSNDLILIERPEIGSTAIIREIVALTDKRLLLLVDDPHIYIEQLHHHQLICETDDRFQRSHLAAERARTLNSQLCSERAELEADEQRATAISELQARIEAHRRETAGLPQLAQQHVLKSSEWITQQEVIHRQEQLKKQIDELRTQIAQPIGFLQRLMGKGSTGEQQKQLALLENELQQRSSSFFSFDTLLATVLQRLTSEADESFARMISEIQALPHPKSTEQEHSRIRADLDQRTQSILADALDHIWATRRIVIATQAELEELNPRLPFDKWIMDVAKPTADQFRHCHRLATSGILFGEVPTIRPPGYRNGTLTHEPTLFEQTWNQRCADGWAVEGRRLVAQLLPLETGQRTVLKHEPLIGYEQHEVRLMERHDELFLAEVAFAPDTILSAATQLLLEQPQLACLTTLGPPKWKQEHGQHIACWINDDSATSIRVDHVELCFSVAILARASFDSARFPTREDAAAWMARFVRCEAPTCVRTRVV